MRIYCGGRLVPVRYLGGGWGFCLGCGARVRVVR